MSLFNAPKFRKPSFKLALIATLLALLVVMLGTYTRLMDIDFGCSDWPICHGQLSIFSDPLEVSDGYSTGYTFLQPELIHRSLAGILGIYGMIVAVILCTKGIYLLKINKSNNLAGDFYV